MNALKILIAVMTMQLVTTFREVTTALATLDMQAMGFCALVCKSIPFERFAFTEIYISDVNECLANNGGCHHNCHNSDGSYSCSCNSGYWLDSDGHTCEGW